MASQAQRYLNALRCSPEEPTLAFLRKLIVAQQRFFPYESFSKLLFAGRGQTRTATLDEYLDGQERFGFGGTCLAQNGHFSALLAELGFATTLVGVTTNGQEDHASIVVSFGPERWHVDLGLMSTFTGPLPLRGPPLEKSEGHRLMRYIPANDGLNYRREIVRDGEIKRLIESKPGPRTLASFASTATRSFAPDAMFMKTLVVYKVVGATELSLWNLEFHAKSPDRSSTRTLAGLDDLRSVLTSDLALPLFPVDEALRVLRERNGVKILESDD